MLILHLGLSVILVFRLWYRWHV